MPTTQQIREWIASGNDLAFYTCYAWKKKRKEILRLDKNECQQCKAQGKYTRAVMVRHVKHLRDRPDLALSVWDTGTDGQQVRQLVSLCADCHAKEHPEQLQRYQKKPQITPERW